MPNEYKKKKYFFHFSNRFSGYSGRAGSNDPGEQP